MLELALVFFVIAAVGGLLLAASVLRNRLAPWKLSLAHALLGACGLVVLVIMLLQGPVIDFLVLAFGLLVAAALGGFFLASFHLRSKIVPKSVVFLHAALALGGIFILLGLLL